MYIAREPSDVRGQSSARPIPVKLDAVIVGVAEVDGFADAVVGSAFERNPGLSTRRSTRARAARVGKRIAVW